ncbi:DUF3082 domain-containing protein [Microcoleus sp. FACHB-1515]|uniref:DUF3082 domain-containing protein n=2 Tax=Cyanophyceae TaxID=3028117 RepID=UPI0016896B51|nr:DUF3082 domain-containing protein [Microcoleus sp. FACHB-1515]MBD2091698.1 DUF3082 domain-containing protein [Microcoleus sp. FACHB-1515]
MTSPSPESTPVKSVSPTPLRCMTGALIAGSLALVMYRLTMAIVSTYDKPIAFNNPLAARLAGLVRTMIVGVSTLGTMVFGIVALGLVALALQLLIQRFTKPQDATPD